MKKTIPAAILTSAALTAGIGCGLFSDDDQITYKYNTETVKNEQFIVAFSEGGQLEAVNSVKVESEMDGSSTIVSIVDEGTYVKGPRAMQAQTSDTPEGLAKAHGVSVEALRHVNPGLDAAIKNGETVTIPGDLLVELDPGSLKDKILSQEISVRTASNAVTKAENDLEIQKLRNERLIDDAMVALRFSKLDLEKFLKSDAKLKRATFIDDLTYLSNKVAITEDKLKWYRELQERKFLAIMTLREQANEGVKTRNDIKKLQAEAEAYEKYDYPKLEQDFQSKIKQAELTLTTEQQTATNNMITASQDVTTAQQKLELEQEKLAEVKDQMNKSKLYAPAKGLVVYHVGESSRYGGSSGIIEKGATLRKGQDIINLPDLSQMMVALKIHESRINQVKPGLFVQVRIDTVSDRAFKGEISYVAPVASAAERWGSNKKVFKCQVAIKDALPSYIRPGASATCRIFVANLPRVRAVKEGGNVRQVKTLKVPIQSVVTTSAGHRVCYLMNDEGTPEPALVDTGYYDQTHIQITKGLTEGQTIVKSPLLHARELNIKGGFFGYRDVDPEGLGLQGLPVTQTPNSPTPKLAPPVKTTQAGKTGKSSKGRPGGGSRSMDPPAELKLTAAQKAKWTAATQKMGEKMADIRARQAWTEMRTLRDDFQADLEKFLTKEQLAQYEKSRNQGDGASKSKSGGGRGGMSLMRYDTDGDGKVSETEYGAVSDRARQFMGEFSGLDTNGDGFIDKDEEAAFRQKLMERFQKGGFGGSQ